MAAHTLHTTISHERFLELVVPVQLQVGNDCMTLYTWLRRNGVFGPARKGTLAYGTQDYRVLGALYVLSEFLFDQTVHDDPKVHDLFDTLSLAWPERELVAPPQFRSMHQAWREEHPFVPMSNDSIIDMDSYKRVTAFVAQSL